MKNIYLKYVVISFLFSVYNLNAQKNSFIVTNSNDTISADKTKLKYPRIIVKKGKKKRKYHFDEIISYYDSKEDEYFEKVLSPFLHLFKTSDSDRYDYKKREMSFLKENDNIYEYIFLNRLTKGKVKLFSHTESGTPGLTTPSNPFPTPGYSNTKYFIAIYDSKLEQLNGSSDLKLSNKVYNILKLYLYGNEEIKKRLDGLYLSKSKAKKAQIIDLINDYNKWAELAK